MTLPQGAVLGDWTVESSLGRGGFAEVYRARRAKDGARAAVKVALDDAYAARLRSEGKIQGTIDSPHVVRVLETAVEGEPSFLVLELVEGGSLRERIRRGRLEPAQALAIARSVLLALGAAHARGIVHRDLKPENVLIGEDGSAKVADFGLGAVVDARARELLASGSFQTGDGHDLIGTIRYMSPEQRDPARPVDARADLYAWGVILFEMLTGEPPSGSEVPSEVVPSLDPRLDRVFRRAYARLEGRYATAEEALADLDAVIRSPRASGDVLDLVQTLAARTAAPRAGLVLRGVAFAFDAAPFFALALEGGSPRLAVAAFVVYDALGTLALGGPLGKRLLGLRVLDRGGGPLPAARAFLRAVLRLGTALALGLPALTALGPEKLALHDLIAGSAVAHDGPARYGDPDSIVK